MIVKPIRTRVFKEGEVLLDFILQYIRSLNEKSVLVVTSKIAALAEKRTVSVRGPHTKTKLIKQESEWAVRTPYCWLTVKDYDVMPSAGIDESNGRGKLIMLPKDSFHTAGELWCKLRSHFKLRCLGVIITDSRTLPLRKGTFGMAVGYAGFSGLKDYRQQVDIFGRKFKYSKVDVADSLAAAAVITMGEGSERQPIAIINNAPITFVQRINRVELRIDPREDMYGPLFRSFKHYTKAKS